MNAPKAPTAQPAPARQWTPQQRAGIETTGCSLLVSAAAGSGKTAVLAERCVHLVCNPSHPCDIDRLLVVTFTEAAAAEMRSRIEQRLRERYAEAGGDHLARQLALVEHAQVSTLHSFCTRVLRQHFQVLGLDPSFSVIDAEEATLLQNEIVREVFADHYEQDADARFQRLVEAYADGNDGKLLDWLVHTYHMLCSVVDPATWRSNAVQRITDAAEMPLDSSALGREFMATVEARLSSLRQRCDQAIKTLRSMGGFAKYLAHLEQELRPVIEHWQQVLHGHGLDALAEVMGDLQLPRLPSIPESTPNKVVAKAWMDSIREDMKGKQLLETLRFSSAQWQAGLREILPHAQVFLDLVSEFETRYAAAKRSVRALDFADLERLALRILREGSNDDAGTLRPSRIARLYHRQFEHVLVDEYQDINEVQDAILTLVSRECVCEERGVTPNLFCVGDVKQSIYRFRLAEPARFLSRHERFRKDAGKRGRVIDLQANFRSREPLLDVLNHVFGRLMTAEAAEIEYDQTHHLRAGVQYPPHAAGRFTGAPVELHLLPAHPASSSDSDDAADGDGAEIELERGQTEAVLLARLIHQMMGREGGQRNQVTEAAQVGEWRSRPVEYRDIVILLRSLKFKADQYAEILRQSGIPVHSESGSGYFQSTEVRDMLSLLSLLDNQRQDIPMAAVVRSPLAALPAAEDSLARIRLAFPNTSEAPLPFHQAVVRYAQEQQDELAARLGDFLRDLHEWRDLAHRRPLAELIWTIYERTGYLAFCAGLADGEQRCANLIHLHERARQFGSFQRQGLYRFMRFLESLEEETDLGQPSVASQADNVVRIMSVHRAKGLEFPVVLIPDLGKKFNLQDCSGPVLVDRVAGLGLSVVDEDRRVRYPSLASTMVQERLRRQALAEELRVLYVATTRAKEHLVLVGTCADSSADNWASMWSGHTGALPEDVILGAHAMLDWIGPAAAAMRGDSETGPIHIISHSGDEIGTWATPQDMRPGPTAAQAHLAELRPLERAPAVSPLADAAIARLAYRYPQHRFASLPAAQSVTAWSKQGVAGSPSSASSPEAPVQLDRVLPTPGSLAGDARPTAIDRGTATHMVLQYLDFSRPCTERDLAEQVNALVSRKLIAGAHASAVDFDAMAWFVQSETGQLLRRQHAELLRELSLHYAVAPSAFDPELSSNEPEDQVMVRGRIDVLVPTPDGFTLIDYKTDRVDAHTLPARAEFYRPQVERYRDAVEKLTGRQVTAVHLVFLSVRRIWSL